MNKQEGTRIKHGAGKAVIACALAAVACVLALAPSCGSARDQTPVNSDMHVASGPAHADSDRADASVKSSSEGPQASADASLPRNVDLDANADLVFEDIPFDRVLTAQDLKAAIDSGQEELSIIDIRSRAQYRHGWIEGAANIPAGQQIALRIDEVSQRAILVLVDQGSDRLAETRQTLIDLGVPEERILVLDGGMDAWAAAGYPVYEDDEIGRYQC